MPAKRELDSSDVEASGSGSSSTGEKKPRKSVKSKWSTAEDQRFLDAWFEIGKEMLWQKVKHDPDLGKRGANGVRSHLEAMVKKLQKEI